MTKKYVSEASNEPLNHYEHITGAGCSTSDLAAALALNQQSRPGRVTFHAPNTCNSETYYPMADVEPVASIRLASGLPNMTELFALTLPEPAASYVDGQRAAKAEIVITVLDGPENSRVLLINSLLVDGTAAVEAFCRVGSAGSWVAMTTSPVSDDV